MRKLASSVLAVTALALVACGGSTASEGSPTPTSSGAAFPVTLQTIEGPVTIEERPSSIVSLSPTATEMLFAIGAGDQVVAVDDQSDFPPHAPVTDLSGFEPNVEAIVGYAPDLVVIAGDTGGVVEGLTKVGVSVLVQPAAVTMDDTYEQIEQLGLATGRAQQAGRVVDEMRRDIEGIVASVPDVSGMSVYHELDDTYYSVTSETFIGQVYSMFGLENIADEARGSGSGYPQLSSEHVVDADPSVIVLADGVCCGQTPETVAARPGWHRITAVQTGAVIAIDDDVASRWGPRIVEFMRAVADGLSEAPS